MAAEIDDFNPTNFSVQDTYDLGMGDQELLQGLEMDDSGDGGNLEPIIKTPEQQKAPSTTSPTTTDSTTEPPVPLSKLLEDNEEDDEEEEDEIPGKPPVEDKKKKEEGFNEFDTLSKELFGLGIFNKDENEEDVEIDTAEKFLERWQHEKKKEASNILDTFIARFGEDYQKAFDAIFVKGADPRQYFSAYNKVYDFAGMDMTIESNQETVIRQALEEQDAEPDDINAEIQRLKDYGDLENVSKRYQKMLIKKQGAELQRIEEEANAKQQQKQASRQQYVQNVQTILQEKVKNKEFDGIPVTPKLANELQDFLLVERYRTPSGETLTEFDRQVLALKQPENHAMKVKVGLLLKLLEKDPLLSDIRKSAVTKETNNLFSGLKKKETSVRGNTGNTVIQSKWNL